MREKSLKEPILTESVPGATQAPKGFQEPSEMADTSKLRTAFLELQALRILGKDQKAQLAATNVAIMEKNRECVTVLEAHGLTNARLQDIGLVYMTDDVHCSVTEEQRPLLFDELRQRGFEDIIKTEPTVNNKTLVSLLVELKESGEEMLSSVKPFFGKKVVVRK